MIPPPARAAALGALLALGAGCGDPPSAPPVSASPQTPPRSAAQAGPRLVFEERAHDFGAVSDVGVLRHTFQFVNDGGQPLVIADVDTSCGCTTPALAKTVYAPGERGEIAVEWDTKGTGRQRQTVTLLSNATTGGATVLAVDAQVTPFVRVDPSVIAFDRVRMGEQHLRRARLACADPGLEVLGVESASPLFAAQAGRGDDGSWVLDVALLPTAPWGAAFTKLTVHVRGRESPESAPVEHHFDVNCNARVFGEVEIDPTMFAVGRVDPGASFAYTVRVQRAGGVDFEVLEARVENPVPPTIEVEARRVAAVRGGGWELVVRGEAGAHLGNIRARVAFATDVPGEAERTLPVMGIVRALGPDEKR